MPKIRESNQPGWMTRDEVEPLIPKAERHGLLPEALPCVESQTTEYDGHTTHRLPGQTARDCPWGSIADPREIKCAQTVAKESFEEGEGYTARCGSRFLLASSDLNGETG
jgi:hypothetical protein